MALIRLHFAERELRREGRQIGEPRRSNALLSTSLIELNRRFMVTLTTAEAS